MLYGIALALDTQQAIFFRECWGACGKGIIGSVTLDETGPLGLCRQPAQTCPCFDKEMAEDVAHIPVVLEDPDGETEPLRLRKLRSR